MDVTVENTLMGLFLGGQRFVMFWDTVTGIIIVLERPESSIRSFVEDIRVWSL